MAQCIIDLAHFRNMGFQIAITDNVNMHHHDCMYLEGNTW